MITYHSRKPLEVLSKDLEEAVAAHGFGVLGVHNLGARLEAKGVPLGRACRVFEVCNPKQAGAVLDRDMTIATALPCRIALYETDRGLELATIEPTRLLAVFGRPVYPVCVQSGHELGMWSSPTRPSGSGCARAERPGTWDEADHVREPLNRGLWMMPSSASFVRDCSRRLTGCRRGETPG